MKPTPTTGFPEDIVEYNTNRFSEAAVGAWYATLPFQQGVAVNSLCWTNFTSHNALVEHVKSYNWSLMDKMLAIVSWYQAKQRSSTPFTFGGAK